MKTNSELWETDPEYRKKVIKELEREGRIGKLSKDEFDNLVYTEYGK